MNFFVQTISLKRPEDRHKFFIYFVLKLLEKSLDLTIVELFFKKVASGSICNCSRNEPHLGNFKKNVPK